jgi:phenylacetate-coenzyme A ligase PaaK-like adenylate-forming protein
LQNHQHIFNSQSFNFLNEALNAFHYQYTNNPVYQSFCKLLKINPEKVTNIDEIPFLPVSFFKSHDIKTNNFKEEIIFTSSGTTGNSTSKHFVKSLSLYQQSFLSCFELFYGKPENYCVLALLPSYLEREGSSLIYMAQQLITLSKHPSSGFYLNNIDELAEQLIILEKQQQPTILIGVSFALLDLFEKHQFQLKHTTIMETGGMKGKRKELTREELHQLIKKASGVKQVHSEYGMTELLSQAYAKNNGLYSTPPWMKIIIKDINDPFQSLANNKTGAINIIDLANIDSCCFIATQDLGKINKHGQFEVLGRFDNSDIRGCNLLVQ